MKYLKKFNEDIQYEDTKDIIDKVLDRLSKKGKLSESEKEFMDGASKGKIHNVTVPKPSGNFWSDMSNPHNSGTMYQLDGVWKILKTVEDEEDEELEGKETSDQTWNRKKRNSILKYSEENPGLKEALNEYLNKKIEQSKELKPFVDKIKSFKNKDMQTLSQKIDYALKSLNGLYEQFGDILDMDEEEFYDTINKY